MVESPDTLIANTEKAVANWNLGPATVDVPNDPYWSKAAALWGIDVQAAQRRICCNCEYYDNTPERLAEMQAVPLNRFDIYASPFHRGYCLKLRIICHTTRSCQAWERKEYEVPKDAAPNPLDSLYPSMKQGARP